MASTVIAGVCAPARKNSIRPANANKRVPARVAFAAAPKTVRPMRAFRIYAGEASASTKAGAFSVIDLQYPLTSIFHLITQPFDLPTMQAPLTIIRGKKSFSSPRSPFWSISGHLGVDPAE